MIDTGVNQKKVESSDKISSSLAEFLSRVIYQDFPDTVIEDAERAVLDWLGSALAGSFEPPAQMIRQVVAGFGNSQDASVFPTQKASAPAAALANGVASHILEFDDVHKGSTMHAAAPIIPAAFAVAEREHASGQAFLQAVILGYEAALRIGEAVNPSHYRFWHPTGTAATFGAGIAAASLLNLNASKMLDTLGTAGTQAAGLWEFNADGAMSKHLHPGKAAFNGILAADLAMVGFTGATRILEGERGFFRATSAEYNANLVVEGLGAAWKISENCYKLHSCCGHTHTAIDNALNLRKSQKWLASEVLDQVEKIEIALYKPGYDIVSEQNPSTPYQAKFSVAYCVAVALLEGRVGLEQFSEDRFAGNGVCQKDIANLLSKTTVNVDNVLTSRYPGAWPSRVKLILKDGKNLLAEADYPLGNPENPVSNEILEDKFAALVKPHFGPEVAQRAIKTVYSIKDLEDMADFYSVILG